MGNIINRSEEIDPLPSCGREDCPHWEDWVSIFSLRRVLESCRSNPREHGIKPKNAEKFYATHDAELKKEMESLDKICFECEDGVLYIERPELELLPASA